MHDPGMELLPPFSSPTISSISSSDLDTESTGSFFHDRSISLGTLMGVGTTFPIITGTPATQATPIPVNYTPGGFSGYRRRRRSNTDAVVERRRKRLRRRRWWWLCSGDDFLKPSSLGEFLEVERRFGEEAVFGCETVSFGDNADVNRNGNNNNNNNNSNGEGMLFADGRVLPPPQKAEECDGETTSVCSFCPFSVSLAGICTSGG
uniref:uncharacterized protein At3g17950-like n=1 Tax=Erigeron canadensis TaxID=72917 RepID=UPI001CB9D10F|nr:uncharacterized protein At3g17950-like [Erigeron canadensis]